MIDQDIRLDVLDSCQNILQKMAEDDPNEYLPPGQVLDNIKKVRTATYLQVTKLLQAAEQRGMERAALIFHKSYMSVVTQEDEDGRVYWWATHPELPGCAIHGDTKDEALSILDEVRFDYLMHFLEHVDEKDWPEPMRRALEKPNLEE